MSPIPLLALACGRPVVVGEGPSADDTGSQHVDSGDSDDSTPVDTGGDTLPPEDTAPDEPVPACDLQSTLASQHFWEGDTIRFTVACTGDLATEDAQIEAIGLPMGAFFDTDQLRFLWVPDSDEAGRYEFTFATRPRGATDVIPTSAVVTIWVADNPDLVDAVPVDPAAYTEEWGLPVVHVATTAALSTTEHPATVTWMGDELQASIKIRGATSASYAKTSFTLDFDDEIEIGQWGVSRDHLVLLANFDDNSHVRQKLVYDQWAAIAEYWGEQRLAPRTFYVVLYVDGAYHGLYVAMDRVDDEFTRQMGFDDSGNLYKAVNHDANFALTGSSGRAKYTWHDGYTKEEGEPESDFSDLDALVYFTGSSSYEELVDGAGDWIDFAEFMDWFLLVHYALAEDSAGKNSYLYHDPSTALFRFTPWDFNHAWGQSWYTTRTSVTSLNYFTSTNRVFGAIQGVGASEDELWERFRAMRVDGPYQLSWMESQLDGYYEQIDDAAQRDWDCWSWDYTHAWWAGYRYADWTDFEGEKAYVYQWVRDRYELFADLVPE